VPLVPEDGVPASDAVPSWSSAKLTPAGRAPISLSAGLGSPVVVTLNPDMRSGVLAWLPGGQQPSGA
jgi:hypothetical protein